MLRRALVSTPLNLYCTSSPRPLSLHSTAAVRTMSSATTFFDLKADKPSGVQDMKEFEGKVVLVVNVASQCGFTKQYTGLEELYKTYKDQGFVILGFPCNQFGGQEPGDDGEIANFCQRNHGVSFPLMKKSDVNGGNANDIFSWLKKEKAGFLGISRPILWNFEKFLVGRDGQVYKRYTSMTTPEGVKPDIEKLLAKSPSTPPTPVL